MVVWSLLTASSELQDHGCEGRLPPSRLRRHHFGWRTKTHRAPCERESVENIGDAPGADRGYRIGDVKVQMRFRRVPRIAHRPQHLPAANYRRVA